MMMGGGSGSLPVKMCEQPVFHLISSLPSCCLICQLSFTVKPSVADLKQNKCNNSLIKPAAANPVRNITGLLSSMPNNVFQKGTLWFK